MLFGMLKGKIGCAIKIKTCKTAWPNGYGVWLRIRRLWVRVPSWSSFYDLFTCRHEMLWTRLAHPSSSLVPNAPVTETDFDWYCNPGNFSKLFVHNIFIKKKKRRKKTKACRSQSSKRIMQLEMSAKRTPYRSFCHLLGYKYRFAMDASPEKKKKGLPTPGIEPGPRRWERRILTTRPYGRPRALRLGEK